ncbi:MAG: hypothetical protein ACYDEV_09520 [Acidiferrobacter sp.]
MSVAHSKALPAPSPVNQRLEEPGTRTSSTRACLRAITVRVVMAAAAALSGCAPLSRLLGPPPGLSRSAVVFNVPFHKQGSEDDRGLAAVAMITLYYHLPIGVRAERALAAQAHTTGGPHGAVLAHALRHAGYFVAIFSETPGHGVTGIDHHIDRGQRLIVNVPAA